MALSFAGAQRAYVEQVAQALKARGVRCFYDADEEIELWRKYLAEELPAIYGEQAAAVVVFASAVYAAGNWTRHERWAGRSGNGGNMCCPPSLRVGGRNSSSCDGTSWPYSCPMPGPRATSLRSAAASDSLPSIEDQGGGPLAVQCGSLAASTSIGRMSGGAASSSPALAINAAAMGPSRCA